MIDFYTWTTPNGRKISIMLEETGLEYTVHTIHIGQGEQHDPEFLKVAPNNKIPAIVDHDTAREALTKRFGLLVDLLEHEVRVPFPLGEAIVGVNHLH